MNCVDVERVNHPELVCPLQPYTCLGMEWLTQVGVVYYFSCVIKRFRIRPQPEPPTPVYGKCQLNG